MGNKFLKSSAMFAAILISAPAFAADALEAPPEPPIAQEQSFAAPVATWSGIYGGVAAGYTWGTFDSTAGNLSADGWNGLGFVGVNLQSGSFVYGVEGDLGYSGAKATLGTIDVEQGLFGSLRARAGVAFDPFMLYGTAGVAATRATVSDSATAGSDTNTHLGWTAGVGTEAMITDNVFGRLEYRYSDYGSKDFNAGGTAVSSGFSDNTVRAGIGLKF